MTDIPSAAEQIRERAEQAREWLQHLEQSRDEQPTRLARCERRPRSSVRVLLPPSPGTRCGRRAGIQP